MPSEDAARRAIAGQTLAAPVVRYRSQREHAARVVCSFNEYVATRTVSPHRPDQDDVVGMAIGYVAMWSGRGASDLDEVELAGAVAVGAIVRFLEIPNRHAGVKATSFRDARARVAEYEALVAIYDQDGKL